MPEIIIFSLILIGIVTLAIVLDLRVKRRAKKEEDEEVETEERISMPDVKLTIPEWKEYINEL